MVFPPSLVSRPEAVRILAAELQKPATWNSLTVLGRELAAVLPALGSGSAGLAAGVRDSLLKAMPAASDPVAANLPARSGLWAMALLLDLCTLGAPLGLPRSAQEISSLPDGPAILWRLAEFLDATGLGRDLSETELKEAGSRTLIPLDGGIPLILGNLRFLGLSKTAPFAARRSAFRGLAMPRLHAAARAGAVDTMLAIENLTYDHYLKTVETPAHHTEVLAAIEEAFAEIPGDPRPRLAGGGGHPPRVGFMIPNGAILAHTEVLLAFLAGLRQLDEPIIEPIVFIYDRNGGALGQSLDRLGVPWVAIGWSRPHAYEAFFHALSERIAALGVEAAVFVSLPLYLAYLGRRPVAPCQIWWSMKFPLPNFDHLDGRVFYRSLYDRKLEIDGRIWRGGPLAIPPPPGPDTEAVAAIRARFPGKTILGTIAREEKIADVGYLAAIVGLLRRHPDTCFLWTGRVRLAEVQDVFNAAQVADRCHFLGWVEPANHIMAFDLFIETYPLTGIMTGWAMALGQPVVSVGSMGFLAVYLDPLLRGTMPAEAPDLAQIEAIFEPVRSRLPGLWATDPGEIGALADALLADPELRRLFGRAQQAYVQTFLRDAAASAAIQARHFADIVRETRESA